jgi:oxygen-independent coproporphyrinogen-3 oxidase
MNPKKSVQEIPINSHNKNKPSYDFFQNGFEKPKPLEDINLYVHIPFCSSRCRYCNFYFEVGWSARILQDTLAKILEESRFYSAELQHPRVRSIYLGGGTPSIIPPDQLQSFLQEFRSIWNISDASKPLEWNFEANPESLSQELLQTLGTCGIDRLSLGVQSTNDQLLARLGRRALNTDLKKALDLIQENWSQRWSMDFISGIPRQTFEDIKNDLTFIKRSKIQHISLYGLTIENRTPLQQWISSGNIIVNRDDFQEELWLAFSQGLENQGFTNYEISNFGKTNQESKHNLDYWKLRPYLGLGPGASSLLPSRRKNYPAYHHTNPNLFNYSHPRRPVKPQQEMLNPEQLSLEALLTGLRTADGLMFSDFFSSFGFELEEFWKTSRNIILGDNSGRQWEANNQSQARDRLQLSFSQRMQLNSILKRIASQDLSQFQTSKVHWPK